MNSGSITFAECAIVRRDLVFISAQVTEPNAQGVDPIKVIRWKNAALSAQASPLTLVSMGLAGDMRIFQGANRGQEHIAGPDRIGPLRDMRTIAGTHYAAGMQRQVCKRRGHNDWVSIADTIRNRAGINRHLALTADGKVWTALDYDDASH